MTPDEETRLRRFLDILRAAKRDLYEGTGYPRETIDVPDGLLSHLGQALGHLASLEDGLVRHLGAAARTD